MTKAEIRRKIKQDAKQRIKGNWGAGFAAWIVPMLIVQGAMFVFYIIVFVVLTISLLASGADVESLEHTVGSYVFMIVVCAVFIVAAGIVLTAPLTLGTTDWYYRLANGEVKPLKYIFNWIKSWERFKRSLGVLWAVAWRQFLFSGVWIVLFLIFINIGSELEYTAYATPFIAAAVISFIVYAITLVYVSVRYGFAAYALVDNPDLKGGEAARVSFRATKGHFWETIWFYLSFIPWYAPSLLILLLSLPLDNAVSLYVISKLLLLVLVFAVFLLSILQIGLAVYIMPRLLTSLSLYARYLLKGRLDEGRSETATYPLP